MSADSANRQSLEADWDPFEKALAGASRQRPADWSFFESAGWVSCGTLKGSRGMHVAGVARPRLKRHGLFWRPSTQIKLGGIGADLVPSRLGCI
jgi:hypothetical protein